MPERSAAEQGFIDSKLDEVLTEFGLSPDSPIRKLVDRDAVVVEGAGVIGQKSYGIKVVRAGMPDVTVRERLAELADDFMFRHHFPKETPTVAATSGQCLRPTTQNLADIAAGRVVVR